MKEFRKDYFRYKQAVGCVFYEPSIVIVFLYRLRKYISAKNIIIKLPIAIIVEPIYYFLTLLFGIHLPRSCDIGPGLLIHHFGGIVLNPQTKIGENCTIRHNVTIGNRKTNNDVPVIGNNVDIGVGAVILGDIIIEDNVSIGANAVVLKSVPKNHIAVGIPSRNIPNKYDI